MSGISGLNGLFTRALDGLNVSQRGMTVVSNNIANVNTEGYARQQLQVGARATFGAGMYGGGVTAFGVVSVVDPFLERQLVNEMSDYGTLDSRRNTLQNIETVISDLDGTGLSGAMSAFFSSWSDMSQNPQSGALRSVVRERGRVVVDTFKQVAQNLNNIKTSLTNGIDSRVDQINELTEQIADLNEAIVNAPDANVKEDLKVQRAQVLQQLSGEIGINYFENTDGALVVQLQGSGFSLVNRFESATLAMQDSTSYGGDVTINGTLPGSGSGTVDLTDRITSGRLAGNLMDRNTVINDQIENLDELAYTFVTEFNNQHQAGYGLDGVTNRNFFATVASQDGSAAGMALDSDIIASTDAIAAAGQDPSVSGVGDSANAELIVALQGSLTMDSGTKSFSQFFSSMGSEVGILAGQVKNSFMARQNLVDKLQIQRENISAVNLDEEAADLMRYQKAFDASARVLTIANEMLDTILRL